MPPISQHHPGTVAGIPGHGWVAMLPPYNGHLIRDVGALSLNLAVVLGVAAMTTDRPAQSRKGREGLGVAHPMWPPGSSLASRP